MNNFVKPGLVCTFTAPTGGVLSGNAYLIGSLLVVSATTVAQTLPFEGMTAGVFNLPKIAGVAWTEGQLLYWDSTANAVGTVVGATTRRIGCAAGSALSAALLGQVRLTGAPAPANVA
jgi:predicted RecA/RadA family phage recombinase